MTSAVRTPDLANALRWRPGDQEVYEIYYLTLNDLAAETGFWIRYALHAPAQGVGEPYLEVWFTFFSYRRPDENFGVAERLPIERLGSNREPFRVEIGDSMLENGRSIGRIEHQGRRVSWELEFEPCRETFLHFPEALYEDGRVDSAMLSPHFSTRFTGTVTIDGRRFELSGAPGEQSRTWGRSHPPHWLWAHCNHFEGDEDAVMEFVCAPQLGEDEPPPTHILYLRAAGREIHWMSLLDGSTVENEFRPGLWRLKAESDEVRIEADIRCRPEDLIEAPYTDPDGSSCYCVHSELADSRVRVWDRANGGTYEVRAVRSTHVEWGDSRDHPEVSRKVSVVDRRSSR